MANEGVLAGYYARDKLENDRSANDLRKVTGVLGLLHSLEQQRQERQMNPLRVQMLQQQIGAQKVASDEVARKAAFYSPANLQQFQTPGALMAPLTPNDDNGNPNTPVEQAPTFDFNKMLSSAASQGIFNTETYANHLAMREQAKATQQQTAQSQRDSLQARLYAIDTRSQDRNMSDQRRADLTKESNDLKLQIAQMMQGGRDTPVAVQGVDSNGRQTVNFARPSQGPQTFDTKPAGAANIQIRNDNSRAAQIQRSLTTSTKPARESLDSIELYRNFRDQGDFAQAGIMAAEALRRSARSGGTRFKADANAMLGSGYGSGNIVDRLENFASQEFSRGGGPTKDTLAKLDKLIGASEDAALENIARQNKYFASQVKGQPGVSLKNAIGAPFVSGSKVIFPDGTLATFKDAKMAEERAQQWLEAN